MRKVSVVAAALMTLVCHPLALADTNAEAIPLTAFSDGIKHWQDRHGKDYARYQPQQVTEIAENLLLYQRDNGGWIENRDPARVLAALDRGDERVLKLQVVQNGLLTALSRSRILRLTSGTLRYS